MQDNKSLTEYVGAFVDELVSIQLTDVVISPGSRSTPMAMVMAEHPGIKVWMNIDERSAGFFALGMAKAKKSPVALLCTSGTAAANYYPAIVEAKQSRVPLIVLTADRPHELRDVGAPQAIDQIEMFGNYPKWFMEMAPPESTDHMIRYVRTIAGRAASIAQAKPAGPVHLNFPFREPLIPDFSLTSIWNNGKPDRVKYVSVVEGEKLITENQVTMLMKDLKDVERGLIICGPMDDDAFAKEVITLANAFQFPILADPLSQARSNKYDKNLVIDQYDAFLRSNEVVADIEPQVVIRFGAMPVSKALLTYLKKYPQCRQIIVDSSNGWLEPTYMAADMFYVNETDFCQKLTNSLHKHRHESHWAKLWIEINHYTKETVTSYLTKLEQLFEGRVLHELNAVLPENSALFVGNSMPVRDLDSFFYAIDRNIKILANRGANGIDGVVSSALGACTQLNPLVLVIGDLSFFHDLNGLLAAKLHKLNVTIVVINNDGGGIFSFLPQAQHPKNFEMLFGTPIGLDYHHAVKMFGGSYCKVDNWQDFEIELTKSFSLNGLSVIEIPTDRESNQKIHRDIWHEVSSSVKVLLKKGIHKDASKS